MLISCAHLFNLQTLESLCTVLFQLLEFMKVNIIVLILTQRKFFCNE